MAWLEDVFVGLNDILLRMTWLRRLVDRLLVDGFGMEPDGGWYPGVSFFLYDVAKIFILLSVLIYVSSLIQAHFPPERTKRILMRFKGWKGNVIGALLGTVTPFCSCSSIPIFIGFTKAGLPIGVTFSFLISSPLVDLASVILLASIFGWGVAIAYAIIGIVIAVVGGSLIDILGMEKHVASFIKEGEAQTSPESGITLNRAERHRYAADQVREIVRRVWLYVLIGVGIGAVIHGYIPEGIIQAVLGDDHPFSVVIATVIGVPMYADIFGTLPIAEALVFKGVGIGTVLAFMMAVTALSLPSVVLLRKVVKPKLLFTFMGIVITGILVTGYLFNALDALLI